ncbi:hypothetical protein CARUB_v10012572mg [Capsella rubella]|uniref:Uncharacterized protein n=1 Tax=Capsella rubella TaxID=81985 RepID=R0GUF2_9BRAS|nr:uncharacterized protein LOC17898076 [Capsella rubella]EOA39436.1 hypothetical protein CARUB_v10012572mg [Capsella rubella]
MSTLRGVFEHEIKHDPEPEYAGTIRFNARIFGGDDEILTFTTLSLAEEFINDDRNECQSKLDLSYFLNLSGISDYEISHAMYHLVPYVAEITSSASYGYFPGCVLQVSLDLIVFDEPHIEESVQVSRSHKIKHDTETEDAGTIRVNARIFDQDIQLSFTSLSSAHEFINGDECGSTLDLKKFLREAGMSDHEIAYAMFQLIPYVAQVTSSASNEYSPRCALEVWLDLVLLHEPGEAIRG